MMGELAAIAAALCWALSPIIYKQALLNLDALVVNLIRSFSATMFMVLVFLTTRQPQTIFEIDLTCLALIMFAVAISPIVGDTLYLISIQKIGVSRSVPLISTYPLYSILFASILLQESFVWSEIVGAVMIVAGIWLVCEPSSLMISQKKLRVGIIAALMTAIVRGLGFVVYKMALQKMNFLHAATVRMIILTIVLLLVVTPLKWDQLSRKITLKEFIILSIAGIIALGVGSFLLFLSLSVADASRVTPLSSISPLFSTIFAFLLLREKVTVRLLLGILLIIIGVCILTAF